MRPLKVTALIVSFAISACSASAGPTPSGPQATALPTATATASAVATQAPPTSTSTTNPTPSPIGHAAGVTPLEHGCGADVARCINMPGATYETSGTWAFLRGLTVTLPTGWSSAEQDAGEFELHQATDRDQISEIYFWRDVVAWVDGAPKPELGTTPDALAAYLLSDPRITVVEGPSRTFNVRGPDSLSPTSTVQARSFSVIVSKSAVTAPGTFGDCPEEACIGILSDVDHWDGGASSLTRNHCKPGVAALHRLGWPRAAPAHLRCRFVDDRS